MPTSHDNQRRWVLDHALVALACVCLSMAFTLNAEKRIYEYLYLEALERQLDSINRREQILLKEIAPVLQSPDSPQKTDYLNKIYNDSLLELSRQRHDIRSVMPSAEP